MKLSRVVEGTYMKYSAQWL